ncbi:hypothetical protein JK217_09785 [Gluconobacter kondonii]|uniref:hypothetical protein n=1 Tax=Gluconobacter kondonii TaxID=941463 RepID=UPI001B8C8BE5|nr:hypothetical protein [Gluconobacter kondonii]MBS1078036.1 hypothetical protein [Gluconobacter kondonii]
MSLFSHSAAIERQSMTSACTHSTKPASVEDTSPIAGSGIGLAAFLGTFIWIAGGYWLFS